MAKVLNLPLPLLCRSNSSVPRHRWAWYDCRAEVLLRALEHRSNMAFVSVQINFSTEDALGCVKSLQYRSGGLRKESNKSLDMHLSQETTDDFKKFWQKDRPTSAGPLFYIWFFKKLNRHTWPSTNCTGSVEGATTHTNHTIRIFPIGPILNIFPHCQTLSFGS